MIASEHAVDPATGGYVDELLARPLTLPPPNPQAVIKRQSDIEMIREYRVHCPQHGELPDGPYLSVLDARTAQRNHWRDHRDERI